MANFMTPGDGPDIPNVIDPQGILDPKPPRSGTPVAKAPQRPQETVCDPRCLLSPLGLSSPEDVQEGDWIAASGWTRPRRVEFIDQQADGPVICVADPDPFRTNPSGVRRIDRNGWVMRGSWRQFPNLRLLWDAAHGR